eukprot:TRINITY_DN19300_c0_g1_i1.p1 TRINITY_DN19300_c0_g1~~TRINITY_DN19300_c0_g1_i1.p1  ORF type:complete len:181 (+),score=40.69 TRINITY_DN19300_c0_g1_i1:86-628(+)
MNKRSVDNWEQNAIRSIAAEQHQRLQCEKAKIRRQRIADAQALKRQLRTVDAKGNLDQIITEKKSRVCSSISDKDRQSNMVLSERRDCDKRMKEKQFQKRIADKECDRQRDRDIQKSKSKLLAVSLGQQRPKRTTKVISKGAYESLTRAPGKQQSQSLEEMARLQIEKMDILVPQRSKWK